MSIPSHKIENKLTRMLLKIGRLTSQSVENYELNRTKVSDTTGTW